MLNIQLVERGKSPPQTGVNTAYLLIDWWNDYSFVTQFYLSVHDEKGVHHDIGNVKIAFKGQETSKSTFDTLQTKFQHLPKNYFSLGQSLDYYQKIFSLSSTLRKDLLTSINDMVFNPSFMEMAQDEAVFGTSLLRDLSLSIIKGQYARVLSGYPPLTDFKFSFSRPATPNMSSVKLGFQVQASSIPSTNIHAIIGRNGVGKTTLLNDMIYAITNKGVSAADFYEVKWTDREEPIDRDYFSSLVSVSFSAFDPFTPPLEQPDPSKGTCYFYIGLKDRESPETHRTIYDLRRDCVNSLIDCFRNKEKSKRWLAAIKKLGSDENFDSMDLSTLYESYKETRKNIASSQEDAHQFREQYFESIESYLKRMSSGHAVVLLTITRLVATVEEKTLVLLDEPESHLHPPLLSAFVRALSDLLYDRNGVAIIATHSPVVIQEVPKSCVWKINRVGLSTTSKRPEVETFGENVGILTREVFGLEVSKSGFHDLLVQSVAKGGTYHEILKEYGSQLGVEGRILLKSLVAHRDGEGQP
jgi:predicted ATPase